MSRWHLMAALAVASLAAPAARCDWPAWMGPTGNGAAAAGDVFPDAGGDAVVELREAWRRPIGMGYSSISIAGERAYTLAESDWSEELIAFSAVDGSELWRSDLGPPAQAPSSTPAVDGERVFAASAAGILQAVDAASGEVLWRRDLQATLGARLTGHGMSTSPLLEGDLLIVLVGGRERHNLVAFDKLSGEVAWSVDHATLGSYSSPVAGELAGERQIVVPAGDRLYAVRPADGALLWAVDGLGYPDRNPLLLPGDRVLLALEIEAVMLKIERGADGLEVEELWRSEDLEYSYSPVVHLDGILYGFDDRDLVALDAGSAEVLWRHPLGAGSLILVDRHLVAIAAIGGLLHAVRAGPLGFDPVARARPFGPGSATSAPPSFAAGRIFVRDQDELVALEVAVSEPLADPPPADER